MGEKKQKRGMFSEVIFSLVLKMIMTKNEHVTVLLLKWVM